MMEQVEATCLEALHQAGIMIAENTFRKSCEFIQLMLETNRTVNLTAITDYQEALYKHLFDSLFIMKLPFWGKVDQIIDIGSGAGIPAILLAIADPNKRVAALDATQKKVAFQQQAAQSLQIPNFTSVWGRAEEIGKDPAYRDHFDLVIARAVAAVNVLAELTIPFAKPVTGIICLYKGKEYLEELQAGQNAIRILGGKVEEIVEIELPQNHGGRSLILIGKQRATPVEYPRRIGIPQKNPL